MNRKLTLCTVVAALCMGLLAIQVPLNTGCEKVYTTIYSTTSLSTSTSTAQTSTGTSSSTSTATSTSTSTSTSTTTSASGPYMMDNFDEGEDLVNALGGSMGVLGAGTVTTWSSVTNYTDPIGTSPGIAWAYIERGSDSPPAAGIYQRWNAGDTATDYYSTVKAWVRTYENTVNMQMSGKATNWTQWEFTWTDVSTTWMQLSSIIGASGAVDLRGVYFEYSWATAGTIYVDDITVE